LSDWADKSFKSVKQKNEFYVQIGRKVDPEKINAFRCAAEMSPEEIQQI
jgi:hypothetical protein